VSEPTNDITAQLTAAAMNLMQMFGAICGAPDDLAVRGAANAALQELEQLMLAAAG
jgi:hypothetical protein